MRELTPAEGFPTLPKIDLLLYKAPGVTSPAVDALHDYRALCRSVLAYTKDTVDIVELSALIVALCPEVRQ
jgi:hypothetical protein